MTRSNFASGFAGGLAALAVFNLVSANRLPTQVPDVLTAHKLQIVDAEGVVRASLGTYATGPGEGVTSLNLYSDEGKQRVMLEAHDTGGALFVSVGADDQVFALDARREKLFGPRMMLYGERGVAAVQLVRSPAGNGVLRCTKLVHPESAAGYTVSFPEE